ncbi:LuxR C-terminal-related transcriptional regulator [Nocardia sp. NPDC059228]|uniref:helix-turn-helix transcriptional regulator n=1 Tax=Nocardia sp. NPDC059228 TaxID=3346777 RepID=UPI0036AD0D1F
MRFTHALVRAALHDGLPLQQRVLLHARAARAIEELYPDALDQHAAALARHYAESALAGDRAPALRWARRAGDNALRDLAFEEAARLYTVALDHTTGGPPADRGRLLLTRATAHFRAGNLEPARADCLAAGELARRTGDANLLAERALILEPVGNHLWDRDIHEWCIEALTAEASLADGDQADGTTVEQGGGDPALADGVGSLFGAVDFDARSAVNCASGGLPESLRARLLARATEAASYLGRWDEIGETSSRALALADRCGDAEALVAALRARQLACTGPEDLAERVRLAARMIDIGMRSRRPGTELWGRLWAIDNQWESGDLTAVETELSRLRWCARHTGGPMATWHVLLTEAALAQARGRFDDALRVAGQARELAESLGHPAGFGAYRSLLGTIGHHRGYPDEAFDIPPAAQRGEVRNQLFAVLGPAFPLAESGRLDDAAGLYRGLGPPPEWDIPPFFRLIVMTVGGSIALALGYTTHIAWFADQLRPYRDRHVVSGAGNAHYFGPVPLWLGKFAAALGDSAAAERELRTALEICRDTGAQGFVVEASTDLAAVLLARGATEEALALAKAELPQAETIGMPPWTDRLRSIAAEASARAVLSPREREVAQLVAAGLSNREIATALVLSERTAQNHVQHILTKLGLTNRAQIVAWVTHAARGPGAQAGPWHR